MMAAKKWKATGIAPWKFYEYKAKYAAEEMSGSTEGTFLQLAGSSEIVPMPSFAAKCSKRTKGKINQLSSKTLSIELRTQLVQ